MIALFKQKSPANIVVLLIFGMLIKMPLFLYPKDVAASAEDGQLYIALIKLISSSPQNGFVCSLLSFGLIYGQALLLNYMVNEYRMTNRQSFLPAMAYILITSLVPEWSYLSAALVASTLIIWAFIKVFKLYNVGSANGIIFNIGLLLGLASFIYFPSLAFVLCVFLGLLILRPFSVNELVLVLFGIITPYYFYAIYLFLTDTLVWTNIFPRIEFRVPKMKTTVWLALAVVLLGVPFLIGGYYIQIHLRKMLIQARKNWSILLVYILLTLFIPFINTVTSLYNWVLMAAPFSAFHASAYLYPQKRLIPAIIFILTVAFILFQQYGVSTWK